jgi:hypothetical protein
MRKLGLLLVLPLLAACGGERSAGRSSAFGGGADCPAPGDALVADAVAIYADSLAVPKPMRFLLVVGGDTALPDPARQTLQNKGPTYLYSADSKAQEQVKGKLISVGDYPSLLVTYHGMQASGDSATVRFGGWYVSGEHDGKAAPRRTLHFGCIEGKWTYARASEDTSA